MMRSQSQNHKAFTLMELMVAVVIVGIVAGFGVPTYNRSMARARERDAISTLEMIREGVRLYLVREGDTAPGALNNPTDFKNVLFINVTQQQGNTYRCLAGLPVTCEANNGWTIDFHTNVLGWPIHCHAGACLTI